MASTAGARDQQYVVSDGQQPGESNLGRCGPMADGDPGNDRIGADRVVLLLRPSQRTKRHKRYATRGALVQYSSRRAIRKVVGVLYADDVGDFHRPQEVPEGHIADADTRDQAFLPRGCQRAELVDKPLVRPRVVHHTQVDRGELPDTQCRKVVFDSSAELIWVVVRETRPDTVPSGGHLADQSELVGVGEECLPDQIVYHPGPVVLRGVDVIDSCVNGRA